MKNLIMGLAILSSIMFVLKVKEGTFDNAAVVLSITGTIYFVAYLLMDKIEELKNK